MGQETETITPGRGSPESAAWFREQLDDLGLGQSAFARLMIELGDDRQFDTILRNVRRMANAEARVSGEMRTLLGLLRARRDQQRTLDMLRSGELARA